MDSNKHTRMIKYHQGWMEHKSQNKHHWTPYWCVLKGNMVFLFANNDTSRDTIVGTLSINGQSRLEKRDGGEREGYKFDLVTANKANRFKTAKFSERELWKAFIEGIAKNTVPDSLDLLPGQIEDVRAALGLASFSDPTPPPSVRSPRDRRVSEPCQNYPPGPTGRRYSESLSVSGESGFDSPKGSLSGYTTGSIATEDQRLPPPPPLDERLPLHPTEEYVEPTVVPRHQYYADPTQRNSPSWFFPNIARHLAEKVLAHGYLFGNTLMRESPDVHRLVISKRTNHQEPYKFVHFKVTKTPDGYKVDVENPHNPFKSLSEVMTFFMETSGFQSTQPMSTNDFGKLGLPPEDRNHDYKGFIFSASRDADSGEETIEPQEVSRTLPRDKTGQMRASIQHQAQTINVARHVQKRPGILKLSYQEPTKTQEDEDATYEMQAPPTDYSPPPYDMAPPPPCFRVPKPSLPPPQRHLSQEENDALYINSRASISLREIPSTSNIGNEIKLIVGKLKPVQTRETKSSQDLFSSASKEPQVKVTEQKKPLYLLAQNPLISQSTLSLTTPKSPKTFTGQTSSTVTQKSESKTPSPPPLPGNHPKPNPITPRAPVSARLETDVSKFDFGEKTAASQQHKLPPPVAQKPTKAPSAVSLGFLQQLEQTIGGLSSTSTTAAQSTLRPPSVGAPGLGVVTSAKDSSRVPAIPDESNEDEIYSDIDHYSNFNVIQNSPR